ncbi:substrate-binding domain-containing protein [Variovorax sp. PvP013]
MWRRRWLRLRQRCRRPRREEALVDYLRSPAAQAIFEKWGWKTP